MVHIVGAGPGAVDLITVRGMELLKKADLVIYTGSLINKELLHFCRPEAVLMDSAAMTLEEIIAAIRTQPQEAVIVRLHTGDPCLYGAIREQMDALDGLSIPYEVVPGVSSLCGAAAALKEEYTPPGVSQSVIITRMAGRTPVPEKESIRALAAHQATMVLFLSMGMLKELCAELIAGGYPADTPAAVVYKATWPQEEEIVRATLGDLPERAGHIRRTALVLVGGFLGDKAQRSRLYHPAYSHPYREAKA